MSALLTRRRGLARLSGMGGLAAWARMMMAAPGARGSASWALPWLTAAAPHETRADTQSQDMPHPDRPLNFPRDFGAHLGTRIEWWYVTGALSLNTGGPTLYGFQITFFRTRTALADRQQDEGSRLRARHLLFAHAALTDVASGKLLHAERMSRWNGLAQDRGAAASAAVEDTNVQIGRWHLRRQGPAEASTYEGAWHDDDAGFGLSLKLRTTQTVLLQGEAGYSRKSPRPGHASGYYSQPQLRVDGRLRLRGQDVPVQGKAWLDHEWSSALLDPEAVGWDWMGLNLDDGGALTVFRLRRGDGSVLWAGGSWRPPGQPVRNFAPHEVRMLPGRSWRSAATNGVYPVEWTIQTPAGRHQLRALADAQELDNRQRTGTVYWEGISSLHGEDGRRMGMGYLEMTGYAGRLQL
jgi:predicted secreted hydrolase